MLNFASLQFLFTFEQSTITLVMNILLGVLIVSLLIGGFVGMIRGVFNASWRLLFTIIMVVLAIFLTKPIANQLANLDLSKFVDFSFEMPISGKDELALIDLTTVKDTLKQILMALSGEDEKSFVYYLTANQEIIEIINEMAMMIVRFITFVVLALLIVTVGSIIETLLYHLLVKLFIPRKVRKKVRLRILAFFEGMLKQGLVIAMLIMPFSAIINSAKKGVRDYEQLGQELTDGLLADIISYLDAYDNSILGQMLFGYTDSNGNSLDVIIMDYVVSGELSSGDELVFSEQISAFTNVGSIILGSGIFGENGMDISNFEYAALLDEAIINAIFNAFDEYDFLCVLLSAMLSVGADYINAENIIGDNIDLSNVDVKEELKIINEIFNALNELGIIQGLLEEKPKIYLPFGEDDVDAVHRAFAALDQSEILRQVLPGLIYKLITDPAEDGSPNEIGKYINADLGAFKQIRWGQELTIIYDSLFQVNKIIPLIELINGSNQEADSTPKKPIFPHGFIPLHKSDDANENQNSDLVTRILENIADLKTAFVGQTDKNGNPIESDTYCLFDSELIKMSINKLLPEILRMTLETADFEFDDAVDIDELVDLIDERLQTTNAIKKEFGFIIDVVAVFGECPDIFEGNILDSQEGKDALIKMAPLLDKSIILSNTMPGILEAATKDLTFGDDIPLTGADLNFRNISFGQEIPNLISAYDLIMDLQDIMQKDIKDILNELNTDDLATLLEIFYESQILNPDKIVSGQRKRNQNFYKIIDYIFENEQLQEIKLSSKVDYDTINWLGDNGEIKALANVFATIRNQDLIDLLTYSGDDVLDKVTGDKIVELLLAVDRSALLSATFGDVLNHLFGNIISNVDFNDITDWGAEAQNFGIIIDCIKLFEENINQIDWLNSDPENVRQLIKALANSTLFGDGTETTFGEFLCNRILNTEFSEYLKDYHGESYSTTINDFNAIDTVDGWSADNGEADAIANIIKELQSLSPDQDEANKHKGTDGLDVISNGDVTVEQLESMLVVLNSAQTMRMVLINALDKSIDKLISLEDIDFTATNLGCLLDMSNNERVPEIDCLVRIYRDYKTVFDNDSQDLDSLVLNDINAVNLESLLLNLHNSKLFNSLEKENSFGKKTLTIFEQIIECIFDQAGLSDKIVDYSEPSMATRIIAISEEEYGDGDGWLSYSENEVEYLGEIENIGNLIRAVQEFDVEDISDIEWLDVNPEKIQNLFKSLAKLRILIDRNYADTNHTILGKVIFNTLLESDFKENLRDYGTPIADMTFVTAEADFSYLALSEDWIKVGGEIDAFKGIIETFQALDDNGLGSEGLNKIDNGDVAPAELDEVLSALNESHSLRMVVVNTIDNTLRNNVKIDEINLDDCNVASLISMDKSERGEEFKLIVEIVERLDNIAPKDEHTGERELVITEISSDEMEGLLLAAHDSVIFNTLDSQKYGSVHSGLTVFEQVIRYFYNRAKLSEKVLQEGETTIDERIILISEERRLGTYDGWVSFLDGEETVHGEISNICILISKMQLFNTEDIAEIDWLAQDSSKIKELFISLAELRILINRQHDDTEHTLLGNVLFKTLLESEDFKDKLCDYGTAKMEMTFETAKADFESLELHSDWTGDHGEIAAFAGIVDTLQAISGTDSGSDGLDKVNSGDITSAELDEVLFSLNESHSLRMVVVNTMDNTLRNNVKIDRIDLQDCNVERLVEMDKSERADEFKLIVDMVEALDEFAPKDVQGDRKIEIKTMKTAELRIFLESSYQSAIFNTFIQGTTRVGLTTFEQVIKCIIEESKLDSKIPSVNDKIASVGNHHAVQGENEGWLDTEVDSLLHYGEITRLLNLVEAFKDSGLDTLDEDTILTVKPSHFQTLLHAVNDSEILHYALPSIMEDIIDESGMKGKTTKEINTNLSSADFHQEIDVLSVFYEGMRISSVDPITQEESNIRIFNPGNGTDDIFEFVTPKENGGMGKSTYSFIFFLKNSLMFAEARGDLLVSLVNDADFGKFIRNLSPNGEPTVDDNDKYNTMENIFTHNAFNANREAYALDHVLLELKSIDAILSAVHGDAIDEVRGCSVGIENLIRHTLNNGYPADDNRPGTLDEYYESAEDDGTLQRAFLSSEILANVLQTYISEDKYDPAHPINWFETHIRNAEYNYDIMTHKEAAGLRGVLEALAAVIAGDAQGICDAFALMGDAETGNSEVASSLFTKLFVQSLPLGVEVYLLSQGVSLDPYSPGFNFTDIGTQIATVLGL